MPGSEAAQRRDLQSIVMSGTAVVGLLRARALLFTCILALIEQNTAQPLNGRSLAIHFPHLVRPNCSLSTTLTLFIPCGAPLFPSLEGL